MADDLARALGKLEGRFDAIEDMLKEQNRQHIADKEEAMRERDRRHEENRSALIDLGAAIDRTAAIAQDGKRWIDETGRPMATAVAALRQASGEAGAERRGAVKAWAGIATGAGAIGGALAFIGKDGIALVLSKIERMLHG